MARMLLRKDATIQLYGMHSWACLFPWDPLGRDFPERVTPLLEEGFLSLWAQQDGQAPSSVTDVTEGIPPGSSDRPPTSPELNGSMRSPRSRRGGKSGGMQLKRRIAAARTRAAAAQQELEVAEAELEAASQRRHGLETWATLVEERLRVAQVRLDDAAIAARAEETKLPQIQGRMESARVDVVLTGTEAEAARKRVEAAGRSVRVARSVRRLRRIEEELEAAKQAVEQARARERTAAEELASRQSALDRALLKIAEAAKAEVAAQRQVTGARRKAARASLFLANLMSQVDEGSRPDVGTPVETAPLILDAEQADKEAQEARAELIATADEVRSVAEMVAEDESRAVAVRGALVEAHSEVARADALVRELEAALAEAEELVREAEPSILDAQADVHAAADRVVAAKRSFKVGRRVWKLSRARRRAHALAAALEVARREAEQAQADLEKATVAAQQAKDRVKEARGVEAEARRGLVQARRRLGSAVGILSHLRWTGAEELRGTEEPFQYLLIVRNRSVLGGLSLEEWARRASGHLRVPRFMLEKDGEALWLYRGEWVVADPTLTLDDLAVLDEMAEETESPGSEPMGGRGQAPDLEAIEFTWERYGGRCVNCGSLANLVIDHVIPVYLGGSDAASNLQLLCRNCSREKSHQL